MAAIFPFCTGGYGRKGGAAGVAASAGRGVMSKCSGECGASSPQGCVGVEKECPGRVVHDVPCLGPVGYCNPAMAMSQPPQRRSPGCAANQRRRQPARRHSDPRQQERPLCETFRNIPPTFSLFGCSPSSLPTSQYPAPCGTLSCLALMFIGRCFGTYTAPPDTCPQARTAGAGRSAAPQTPFTSARPVTGWTATRWY